MTLEQAQEKLAIWQSAEDVIATRGQSYQIGKYTYTQADLKEVKLMIARYEGIIAQLAAGRRQGARALRAVPRDY